jgi:hypothetical protein
MIYSSHTFDISDWKVQIVLSGSNLSGLHVGQIGSIAGANNHD